LLIHDKVLTNVSTEDRTILESVTHVN